jgi:hypothetical protein
MAKDTWILEDVAKGRGGFNPSPAVAQDRRDIVLLSIAVSLKRIADGIEALGITIAVS